MKILIEREPLMASIQNVMKAISSKTTIPILSGIKFEANEQEVKLTGSNSDITIESVISREEDGIVNIHEIIPGQIVVQAKFLPEIIRKLPDNQIEIQVDDDMNINIRSGHAEFKLNGQDPEEYPQLPVLQTENSFDIQIDLLKMLIRQTNFAVSTSETRPILTGVHIKLDNNELGLVATDSHRLASRKITIDQVENLSFNNVVIPGKSLSELNKILEDTQDTLQISVTDNQILFRTKHLYFLSRLLDGNYPETSRLIPDQSKTVMKVNSKDLIQSIDRASLLAKDNRNNIVKLVTQGQQNIQITSHSPEIGQVEELLQTISIEGEEIKISFNAKYMIDALRAIDSEQVLINFTGAMRPFVIRPEEESEQILQLVTPVRTY
ncbi:DNA polymerase III subunit beta [Tenuibacillus multivorans]|uniref:Beta sliding clamp n=1 Tax=Tenuibacillus multivorans TaxID=237069 RepID=A0A1G9W734_9BACI|nr:DNA polymerase III subunit beta [Tenuibacillus multivorans]GEL76321.1 DNA polymerase III subunit beta [Tenuibacillus multivorans]SDM79815.1 DNA polymerase-3 subunit beta [Tenuibacillus multivorans]